MVIDNAKYRYCTHWYKIASQRINASWWDRVLAPLKQLESVATGGIAHYETFQDDSPAEKNEICLTIWSWYFSDDSSQILAENTDLASGLQREMTEEGGSSNLSFGRCGPATRESLEDMELAIKGLTEPLPVNQQVCVTFCIICIYIAGFNDIQLMICFYSWLQLGL